MNQESYTCCFTGHRRIPYPHRALLPKLIDGMLDTLISRQVTIFRTGGAMGFDTMVALKILEKREQYPHIRLELILPCRDQASRWDAYNQKAYAYVLARADSVICLHDRYTSGCMLERNRRMVQGSQFCIGYCNTPGGGSAYTLEYAKSHGLRVINIAAMLPPLPDGK
ncbi:MAG: DUF1273 family protein [Clostridia bacterium]|nr:DUF1273 family protein [Clostridia bacterium]